MAAHEAVETIGVADFDSIEARLLQYSADVDARATNAMNSVSISTGKVRKGHLHVLSYLDPDMLAIC
jgi:hypothetical protein